jgi:hypothetical protein
MRDSITADTKVRVSPRVYAREFGEEMVLLDFGLGEYFGLDPVGAEIWRGLETGLPLGAIAERIVLSYDVTADAALQDVVHLVAELRESALLETT